MNVPAHSCDLADDLGNPLPPAVVTCGACFGSWCGRCDPAPAAMCHWCHGRGHSTATVPPRQRRAHGVHYPGRRTVRA